MITCLTLDNIIRHIKKWKNKTLTKQETIMTIGSKETKTLKITLEIFLGT